MTPTTTLLQSMKAHAADCWGYQATPQECEVIMAVLERIEAQAAEITRLQKIIRAQALSDLAEVDAGLL